MYRSQGRCSSLLPRSISNDLSHRVHIRTHTVIADDRGKGRQQLIVSGVRSEQLHAASEIACSSWPLVAVDHTGEMPALQPQAAFNSVTFGTGRSFRQLIECLAEVCPGLGECAAPTCLGARGSIGRDRVGEPLALLVMGADQRPIRLVTAALDHRVCDSRVQAAGHARWRELPRRPPATARGGSANPLMRPPRLEPLRVFQFVDRVVDIDLSEIQHCAELAAVSLPSDDRRRANHGNRVCAGPKPGE